MRAKAWITIPHIKQDEGNITLEEEVLPLVLCCDCKYFDGEGCCMKIGMMIMNGGNWFCADGERRESE